MTTLAFNPALYAQPMTAGPKGQSGPAVGGVPPGQHSIGMAPGFGDGGGGLMTTQGPSNMGPNINNMSRPMPAGNSATLGQEFMMNQAPNPYMTGGGNSATLGPQFMMNNMAQSKGGAGAQTTGAQPETTDSEGNWKGFGDFFGGIANWLDEYAGGVTGIGSIAGALNNANDTRQLGVGIQSYLDSLGGQLNSDSQFQGYGVTSGTGENAINSSFGYGEDGKLNLDLGVGANADMLTAANTAMNGAGSLLTTAAGMTGNQSNVDYAANASTAMQNALADPSTRQQEVYNQMMATQNPELNRMQTEQQAAEYARGRGGVRGSQYGGTAEDAAMARARAQASNQAMQGAMQQTNAERDSFANMAAQYAGAGNQAVNAYSGLGSMLGNLAGQQANIASQQGNLAYLPMQQQMALMQLGQGNADMAQTGQLTGLDYMTQLALGGANANMQAQHSANQLTGNLYDTLLSNIGGAQGSDGGSASGLLGAFGNGFDWLTKLLGGQQDGES